LRKLYTDARRADAAWCLCQVLHLLKLAEPEESRFFERGHSLEPAPAQTPLEENDWLEFVIHPSADPRVTEIFALIEPVVIAVRGQTLPALGYDPYMAVDLSQHPYPLPAMLFFAAGVMGMPLPPTFENHHEPGGLLYLNSNPPSIVMGLSALQQLPPQTAAFIAARQLANYRPGFLLRHVLPSIPMLKAWLFAAFKACSPHFPISAELEQPVLEGKAALERYLPSALFERPKRGFGVPLRRWFEEGLIAWAREILSDPRSQQRGWTRQREVATLLAQHEQRTRDHAKRIWALVCLELWAREHVDGHHTVRACA
jgi:hypothetical protein